MSDALENLSSFGGNPGEPVPEVDPEDLKTIWQEARDLEAKHPGHNVAIGVDLVEAICKPGANAQAVWYRSSMILGFIRFAPGLLAPWVKDEQVSDAVFRTMAAIPMEWIGHTEPKGPPYDVEELFRRLREGDVQNG